MGTPEPATPLTLRGIADTFRWNFWRVRKWRDNYLGGKAGSRQLPRPDVLDEKRSPVWSYGRIEAWAAGEGLWPVSDQAPCSVCRRMVATYPGSGEIRPHGFGEPDTEGTTYACEGSCRQPGAQTAEPVLVG